MLETDPSRQHHHSREIMAIRPVLKAGLTTVAASLIAHGLPKLTRRGPVRRLFPGLEGRGNPDHIALTFDDGPDPVATPKLLDMLQQLEVHATFFVLGEQVRDNPSVLRDMVQRDHEIGIHGWDHHGNGFRRSPLRVRREVQATAEAIYASAGVTSTVYRPPHGVITGGSLWATRSLGLRTVLWSAQGDDWTDTATAASILERLRPDLSGGATVVLHDSDRFTAPRAWQAMLEALPSLVGEIRSADLHVGPLREHGLLSRSAHLLVGGIPQPSEREENGSLLKQRVP